MVPPVQNMCVDDGIQYDGDRVREAAAVRVARMQLRRLEEQLHLVEPHAVADADAHLTQHQPHHRARGDEMPARDLQHAVVLLGVVIHIVVAVN